MKSRDFPKSYGVLAHHGPGTLAPSVDRRYLPLSDEWSVYEKRGKKATFVSGISNIWADGTEGEDEGKATGRTPCLIRKPGPRPDTLSFVFPQSGIKQVSSLPNWLGSLQGSIGASPDGEIFFGSMTPGKNRHKSAPLLLMAFISRGKTYPRSRARTQTYQDDTSASV